MRANASNNPKIYSSKNVFSNMCREAVRRSLEMWELRLRDGKEVTVRFLNTGDRDGLFQMFSSMSGKALEWSMAPYTVDVIDRWIGNISRLIPLVAEHNKKIVGYAVIYKHSHQRRKGIGDLAMYLHQDFQSWTGNRYDRKAS